MATTPEVTLFPHQLQNARTLYRSVVDRGCGIDASDTGTGKSITALTVASALGRRPSVVCPLSVGPGWETKAAMCGVTGLRWMNYERARNPRSGWASSLDPDKDIVLFDESHRTKSPTSQQAQLVKLVKDARVPMLMLSATPFSSPLETRAVFHATDVVKWSQWHSVLRGLDCFQMKWIKGRPWKWNGTDASLRHIRECLSGSLVKTKWADVPGFQSLTIQPTAVTIAPSDRRKLDEIVADLTPSNLGDTQKERSAVEMFRVPSMVEMAKDLMESGNKVVAFFNYTEPLLAFAAATGCPIINGETDVPDRKRIMAEFQKHRAPCALAANSVAGGEGVDLQDLVGVPVATLISPPWSATTLRQIIGRTHRIGAVTPALHYIIFAGGTVEENGVLPRVQQRSQNIEQLTDTDLYPQLKT